MNRGDWMETFTGRQFYPMSPRAEDVDPVDIAHALGMLCRYNGHVKRFYSVAEHCVLMSDWVEKDASLDRDDARRLALWALLHDATEAYVGDMIRPLKRSMPDYVWAENKVMLEILDRFELSTEFVMDHTGRVLRVEMPAVVHEADNRILLTERAALMPATGRQWGVDDLELLPVQIHGWGQIGRAHV